MTPEEKEKTKAIYADIKDTILVNDNSFNTHLMKVYLFY